VSEAEEVEAAIRRVASGVQGFADEMREQGIHVGLGKPGRCVTCGEPWPCAASKP
jgi:hypothetical protein